MGPIPNRNELESMKRADLQKLCKDYGVKANLKTEALIDLLLNEIKPSQPAQRSVSRRISSRIGSRRRGRSNGSMIVHDTDDEEATDGEVADEPEPEPEPQPGPPPPAPTSRAKKAKEMQKRLGVGRPVIVGGSGARTVTKSTSKQRPGRSRGAKPTEVTILEEPEPETADASPDKLNPPAESNQPVSSRNTSDSKQARRSPVPNSNSIVSLEVVEKHVAATLRPIHEQLESLKTELGQIQSLPTEVARLNNTLVGISDLNATIKGLTLAIEDIRTQFGTLSTDVKHLHDLSITQTRAPGLPGPLGSAFQSTSKKASSTTGLSFGLPSSLKPSVLPQSSQPSELVVTASSSKSALPHPGFAPSTLGKRHRDPATSIVTSVFDDGQEDGFTEAELATKISRPTKKKARLSQGGEGMNDNDGNPKLSEEGPSRDADCQSVQEEDAANEPSDKPRIPSFTIFSGPEEPPEEYVDPPPPTNLLPESYALDSPPPSRPTTSTAHATENQNPFTFPFLPQAAASQAMFPVNLPNFPFPEPPQSPSPSGPSSTEQRGDTRRQEPTGLFQPPFGVPTRPRSGIREPGGGFIDPAALTRPPDRPPTSNDIAAGLGLTAVRLQSDGRDQNLPAMKRTMYGTELEGDTRFGDFGVEGVGSGGFWTGGRF